MKAMFRRFGVVLAALAWLVALPQLASAQGVDIVARGLAAQANASLPGSRVKTFQIPAGLGWDSINYPVTISARQQADGQWVGAANKGLRDFFPPFTAWPKYWLNAATGSNSNDCSTEALACKSLWKPLQLAAAASQTQIQVWSKGGPTAIYDRNNTFTLNGTVTTVTGISVGYVSYGGLGCSTATARQPALTWSGSGSNSFVATLSSTVTRLQDMLAKDRFGNDVEMIKLSTAAAVDATPDSWAQVSGSIYVHRRDGATPTTTNTRILVGIKNLYVDGTTQINVGLFADTPADCWVVEGGDAAGFRTNFTGGAGGAKVVIGAENTSFVYSGAASGSIGAFAAEGVNGLVFCSNCYAGSSGPDAFNVHNALGATTNVLMINPVSYETGKIAVYVSTNWLTTHDSNVASIFVCGKGRGSRGVTAHFIQFTKTFMACPDAADSLGDVMNGGGNLPTEIKAEDNAELWIDTGTIRPGASNGYGYVAAGAAKIHFRDTPLFGSGVIQGTATVDAY